jgi:hypothetical protein
LIRDYMKRSKWYTTPVQAVFFEQIRKMARL